MASGRLSLDAETSVDRVVFTSPSVRVGAFRCPTWHPLFCDSGPIEQDIFVFPRRTVRLCHEGGDPFLADPTVVTLYNSGQRYRRTAVGEAGDECDWFAVDREIVVDAVRHFDSAVSDRPDRPFRHLYAPCPPHTYLTQRRLFNSLDQAPSDCGLFVEEAVVSLLSQVLAAAYGFWGEAPGAANARRQRETAERVKVLLSGRLGEPIRLAEIARQVGLSVFHLCRTFRAATGSSLHAYRNRVRLQSSLERVSAGDDLTAVALQLGYSSHSHFSAAFRQLFGVTPSALRGSGRPRGGHYPLSPGVLRGADGDGDHSY